MKLSFAKILPDYAKDRIRYCLQLINSSFKRLKWFVNSVFSKRHLEHLHKRVIWKKNEIDILNDWFPFISSPDKGEKLFICKLKKNNFIPPLFGRPKIWPKATRCFPEKEVSIYYLNNIIVTKFGQVFDFYGRTIKGVWHSPPIFFHKLCQRKFFGIDLSGLSRKNEKIVEFNELIVVQQLTNKTYGHFLIEILPRMLMAKVNCDDNLPIYFTINHEVYKEALAFLDIDIEKRLVDASLYPVLKAKKAYIPKYTKRRGWLGCSLYLDKAVDIILEKLSNQNLKLQNDCKRIFVARPNIETKGINRTSRLINIDQVEGELLSRGFIKVYPEKLSFAEQVLLFHNAEVVIGEHGSAMFNAIFCKKNTLIFDFHAAKPVSILYDVLQSRKVKYVAIMSPEGSMVSWKVHEKFNCSIPYLKEALDAYEIH